MDWILVAGSVVLGSFLFIPLRLVMKVTSQDQFFLWVVEVVWLGGALRFGLDKKGRYIAIARLRRQLGGRGSPTGKQRAQERTKSWLRIWRETSKENRTAFIRLLRDTWFELNFSFSGEGYFGFEDPAITGWVQAAICTYGADFNLRPDYTHSGLRGEFESACNVRPFRVIGSLIRFGSTLAVNLVRQKYRGGWEIWQA